MPELRLQRHVGNGAIAEHPVTQMPAATVSGKACAVSAAAMPAASVFATMPAPSVFATMPAATPATMPPATTTGICFECEERHHEE